MITKLGKTMRKTHPNLTIIASALLAGMATISSMSVWADIAQEPLTVARAVRPIVMLALSNDHQLYKEAYDDYTDIDNDGALETSYENSYNYYGYFGPDLCYDYGEGGYFLPTGQASNHQCSGNWSGNFLNWATMTRMDLLRRVLYGGYRSADTSSQTILERAMIPSDSHAFSKVFAPAGGATDMALYTPFDSQESITLCNVTAASGESQDIDTESYPPLIRVGAGRWILWSTGDASHVQLPCAWEQGTSAQNIAPTQGNANDLGTYNARIETCVAALEESNCKRYPAEDSVKKPTGIIQQFGDEKAVRFGMVSGSYGKSVSGGVLRRTAGFTAGNESPNENLDEINLDDGTFTGNPGIISTINAFRINQYDFDARSYTDGCVAEHSSGLGTDACTNWGNPMAEIVLESLRYLAGKAQATGAFEVDDSAVHDDLGVVTWDDPITANEWCTKCNILAVTGGVNSFDRDDLANDLTGLNIITETNAVGTGEGIGGSYVVGGNAASNDGNCYIRDINSLAEATGVCPSGGKLKGGWDVAGISYYAHVNDIRSDRDNDQFVATRAIDMGDGMPMLTGIRNGVVPIAGGASIRPMCITNSDPEATVPKLTALYDDNGNVAFPNSEGWGPCALWGVLPMNLEYDADGYLVEGDLYSFWEDTAAGGDSELDAISRIHFCIWGVSCDLEGDKQDDNYARDNRFILGWGGSNYDLPVSSTSNHDIVVTSSVVQFYSSRTLSFGYVIEGLFRDSRNNADADQCNNGRGNGDGLWLDEAIPGEIEIVRGKNKKKDTEIVKNAFSIADINLGISDDMSEREQRFCGRRFKRGDDEGDIAPLLKPPLWYATKYGGFVDSDENELPDVQAEWDTDGDGDPDGYHMLYAPQNISESFDAIFDMISGVSSSSSVVANTFELRTGAFIFQGRFDSSNWTGDLLAFPIDLTDGSLFDAAWSAKDVVEGQFGGAKWNTDRVILTSNAAEYGAVPFRWDDLSTAQQALLNRTPGSGDTWGNDELGEDRLDFIRGDRSNELQQDGSFRDRDALLGDIVNSDPIFVGKPPFDYSAELGHDRETYSEFIRRMEARDPEPNVNPNGSDAMLYVGGNDGMLHGFDVDTGEEVFAYVPRGVFESLPWLPYLDYERNHRFFVDGGLVTGDIVESTTKQWTDQEWHTALVGTLGAGGKGVFALDVSDPSVFTENTESFERDSEGWAPVYWDFTASDSGFDRLGYTFSAPTIVQTVKNYWMAAFGNGYGSTDGSAVLYLVKISGYDNGTIRTAAVADEGPRNGLSSVAPVDLDGDKLIDYIYAGDLKGNLWRFEPGSTAQSWGQSWVVSFGGEPLFVANRGGDVQPITIRPAVFTHPRGGVMVVFGTGKYFEIGDADADPSVVHSLYGVWDRMDGSNNIRRAHLMPQSFLGGGTASGYELRVSSNNIVTWYNGVGLPAEDGMHGYLGWFLDLVDPTAASGSAAQGELVAAEIRVRGDRVIFTSMIPSDEPCEYGGEGWLIELSYLSGRPPSGVLFDLDGSGGFNLSGDTIEVQQDGNTVAMAPNAKKSRIGIIQQPAIVGDGGREFKYASGGMPADVEVTLENPGTAAGGRAAWLELQ